MVDMEASGGDKPRLASVQGRQGTVSFRPYRDIKTRVTLTSPADREDKEAGAVVELLYPEILCHLFSFLDTQSKGRAAQVIIQGYLLGTCQADFCKLSSDSDDHYL